uniref:Uncharacterized protein n=1 Tax=Panagrolaimus davidi TaxID=227884 RepID=A0A914PLF9_9BILA
MESRRIVTEIQKFPMLFSPIIVGGNVGSGKLKNEEELKKFVLQESKSVKKGCYLLEECMNEKNITEFWVWSVISADGTCIPYSCSFGENGIINVENHQKTSDPMLFQAYPFDDKCEKTFPKLKEFIQNVATILKPPGPHIFGVKGFQRKSQTADYFLRDVVYGINGERETVVTLNDIKISHETVVLLNHLCLNYVSKIEYHETHPNRQLLWYPCVKGILQNQEEFSKMNSIKSKLEYRWFIETGQKMETSTNMDDDFMLCLTIDNSNFEELKNDTEFIRKNFHPKVIIHEGST